MSEIRFLNQNIQGENLTFTDRSALFWAREKALIISDLHVGKTAHFRKYGIAVPSDILNSDLEKLEKLIIFFKAEKLIIVGDFLHAGNNSDIDIFCVWRSNFPQLEIILVRGNHDRINPEILEKACIKEMVDELCIPPFTFNHDPLVSEFKFFISGHIHPGVLMESPIQRMKFPCFAVSGNQLILPAFSSFTGLNYKTLGPNFIKIAFAKGHIFIV